jgi:hypothetical protein
MTASTCRRQDCTEPAEVEDFAGSPAWCEDHGRDLDRRRADQDAARAAAVQRDRDGRTAGANFAAAHLGRPWSPGR